MFDLKKLIRTTFFLLFSLSAFKHSYGQINCNFSLVQDTGCIPYAILATPSDTSSIITERRWYLTTCTGAIINTSPVGLNSNYSYIPTVSGCYCLRLWVKDNLGDTCSYQQCNILVSDTPRANAQVTPSPFCAPQTVTLNMTAIPGCGTITQTQIQWGCGNISTFGSPPASTTHLYTSFCNPQCYNVNIVMTNSCGCIGATKLSGAVCVVPKPVANFTVDVSSGVCVNSLTSHFTADSSAPNYTYKWFVNGTQQQSSNSRYFTHTFQSSINCYEIMLVVTNSLGCADTLVRDNFICVYASPQLCFNADTSALCVDTGQSGLLCLRNCSQPFLPNPKWYVTGGVPFVNLGPFLGDTVCVLLSNPGTYAVKLLGSYGPNCVDSLFVPSFFTLNNNPVVCFDADDTVTCSNSLCTVFHNCSQAPPGSTFLWNFGSGVSVPTSTLQNPPQICYTGRGDRNISLSITSSNGCFSLLNKTHYIRIDTVSPEILISEPFGCSPHTAFLSVYTGIHQAPYYGCTYEWWVYEQHTSNLSYHHLGANCAPVLTMPGCYDVKLKVTTCSNSNTGAGCISTVWDTASICVGVSPICTMIVSPDTMCYEADSVSFNFTGSGCNSNRYIVHFGDEPNPTAVTYFNHAPFFHTYQSFGSFDAWVIPVQDSCESDSALRAHIIVYPPAANFSFHTSCLSGDTVCLTNLAVQADRYHWAFGCRPDTFNVKDPCLLLPHCDTCTVTLTAYNDTTHCVHTKVSNIQTACGGVIASLALDPTGDSVACGNHTFHFYNTTPGHLQGSTLWDWDDANGVNGPAACPGGACTIGDTATKTILFGNYVISMVYVAPGGCRDTIKQNVRVCDLHCDFTPNTVCLPDSFHFVSSANSILGCDTIIDWLWDFGNGDTTHEQYPVRYFLLGTRNVTLTITNSYGCKATKTKTVTIGTPVFSNWSIDTIACPGSTVCITNTTTSGVALTETWQLPGSNYSSGFSGHTPPCLTYNISGDFPLIYTTSGGTCYKSDTVVIHVHNPVLSGYLSADYAPCPPLFVCGTNTSQWVDSITDVYTWNFGNFEFLEINPCDFYGYAGTYPVTLSVLTNNGCRDTIVIDTVVVDGPYGKISHSPRGICSCKDSVDFEISTVKAAKLIFVYGCNQGFLIDSPIVPIGTDLTPTVFNYRIPYCIADSCLPQVTFGDVNGCNVLYNDSFVYVDSPVVGIYFNNYGICLSGTANFFDSTTFTLPPNISYDVDWFWEFGDSLDPTTSNVKNPTHYYSQPGVYPVTLKVHSNFGCYDSVTSSSFLVIPKYPIVGFYADDSLVCAEATMCFHDTSYVDSITGPQFWYWDFGDGKTDSVSGPNPCHAYANGGYYTVHLCLYDSIGCGDCDSGFVIRVISNPIADAGPDTVFCLGVQVQLSGSGSTSCLWSPANLVSNPAICNPTTVIIQDTSFVLTVIDTFGCFGKDTLYARVANVTANFNVTATSCLEDSLCVTDVSTNINGVLVNWEYNFTDVDSLSGANVCHKYSTSGNYDIIETVTDSHGCFDTTERPVIILPQPIAAFSLNDTVICSDQQICFTDLSTSITTIQTWNWNFGSNQGSYTGSSPSCHTFSPPYYPTYSISLAVTDLNQCHDTAIVVVTVNEIPQANFSWALSCEDTPMPLTSTSINGDGAIDSCIWTLWLGAPAPVTDYNCNTSFLFAPGMHDVQLIVHDLNGCIDTIVKTVQTDSLSQLVIYPGDTTLCIGDSVTYTVSGVFDNITWTPSVWLSDPYSSIVTVTPLGNVGYIVSAVNGVCEAASDTFGVQVIQHIPIDITATPDKIVLGLSSNIASQIPAPIDSIVWTPDTTLDCSNCYNPVATPRQTTTYCATIYYGKNGVTCTNLACVTITVLNSCDQSIIYLPNTFTPNGDGVNDIFMIRGIAATKVNYFRIFDRWGKLVYETKNGAPNETTWGWDGTDRNGEKLNPAVFVYTYEIECINHDIVTGNGNVTLVR